MTYRPEFEIDNEILTLVSDIAVLVDRIPDNDVPVRGLRLRRNNRIRSIQSSLASEGNTLSLEEVTDIIDGKRVLGDPREIGEVKGAVRAYDMIESLDPYRSEDLLRAHAEMMAGLVDSSGEFRDCEVGVYKGNVPVHIAPHSEDVPALVGGLIDWAKSSDVHPLIKGCIFHCRFEYIHPFVDGNGRMGRLWHTLILSKWKRVFAHIPIETLVKLSQKEYYGALAESDKGNVSVFIKFMLRMTFAAVDEYVDEISYRPKKAPGIEASVLKKIRDDPGITSAEMAKALGVSDRTVKRYLSAMTEKGLIKREGSDRSGYWKVL